MHNKGQGALEYLLLIGGGVLVAGIVLVLVLGLSGSGISSANSSIDVINEAKAATGVDTSLVQHSSFEKDSPQGIITGPNPWHQNTAGDWSIVSGDCYNGNNCLKLSSNACTGIYQYIPISPGKAYYSSVYKKGYCRMHAHLLDTAGSMILNIGDFAGNISTSEWQKISAEITLNSASNRIIIKNSSGTSENPPSSGTVSQISQIRLYLLNCSNPPTGSDYCDMVTFREK